MSISGMNEFISNHYKENRQRLVKFMRYRAGDEFAAEDIVQEAYTRAIQYYDSLSDEDSFGKWFSQILSNALKDYKRQERGHIADEFNEEYIEGQECTFYSDKVMEEIYQLIDTKSVAQMEVLNLHFKHGYSAKDVASISNTNYSTARGIIAAFRKELRDLYG